MKSKIRNIVIVNDFNYIQGGASKVAIQTANLLAEQGKYNIYFFSGCKSDKNDLDDNVIDICVNQEENLLNKNKLLGAARDIYNIGVKKELRKLLSKLKKEETIIHIHGYTKSLSSSVFSIIDKMGFKMCLTLHDYFSACPNGAYFNYKRESICYLKPLSLKCVFCNCDSRNYFFKLYRVFRQNIQNHIFKKSVKNVITISDFSEKILKKTLGENVKIKRINNPIDLDKNAKKVDILKNDIYLFVGRITLGKGVDIFCDAVEKLNLNGVVVGDGPELSRLKEKFKNVKFVGWKSSNEVKEYMKKSRALIFPSVFYEAAPLTPLESMQYGVPCICSSSCAAIDHVNESTGIRFNPYKKDDLIKKIEEFNKLDLSKISANCFDYCNNIGNNYIRELVNYYKEVIK